MIHNKERGAREVGGNTDDCNMTDAGVRVH